MPLSKGLIPLKDFFKNSEIAQVQISPNGKYLAYLKSWEGRMNIHIRPVDNLSEKRITNQKERDIVSFFWKENNTLIFLWDEGGDENYHIFRAFVDGKGEKNLTPFDGVKAEIVAVLDNISEEEILIGMNKRNKEVFDAYRLNIKTGDIKMAAKNPGHAIKSWTVDHKGWLRVAVASEGPKNVLYYRDTEEEEFQKIIETNFKDELNPYFFTFDNKKLYAFSNLGRDKGSLVIFDPKQKKEVQILFSHPEVDVNRLFYSKKRKTLTAISYVTEKLGYHFLDPDIENIFQELKTQLPDQNILLSSSDQEENLIVVYAESDRCPGSYYLFNMSDKSLSKIADKRPWLKTKKLAEMTAISYKARDGLTIPAYLTLPRGQAKDRPLPVVVHPHGGPSWRDVWEYNPEVQFLASRGYAVFQVNFRGSTGYGKQFWTAGFKQWGRAMQDDITDGVKYLIEKGIADKDKVAIFGASYGGYAVLAGLAFTPDLYACGVNYVGISNIFTYLNTIPPYWKKPYKEIYEQEIGHPEKDKELLRAVSPVFHADKIKAPLFVAHGTNDPRVKKSESDQIVKALEDRGVAVPYLVKENEGHGFLNEENRLEFYVLMEAFLRKCLNVGLK